MNSVLNTNVVMAFAMLLTISDEPLPHAAASVAPSNLKGTKYKLPVRFLVKYTKPTMDGTQ